MPVPSTRQAARRAASAEVLTTLLRQTAQTAADNRTREILRFLEALESRPSISTAERFLIRRHKASIRRQFLAFKKLQPDSTPAPDPKPTPGT